MAGNGFWGKKSVGENKLKLKDTWNWDDTGEKELRQQGQWLLVQVLVY
jgi:hypothetical protein